VRNVVYCFDLIWEIKENNDKTIKEKMHSKLLFDLLSHDIGNYHQLIYNRWNIATFIVEKIIISQTAAYLRITKNFLISCNCKKSNK
jgi:hypothetical protein